ncbi:MAG: response regulator transcription factor [Catenulispora sp.]
MLVQRGTLWRAATAALLEQESGFRVVAQAGSVDALWETAPGADVAVLDAEVPGPCEIEPLCDKLGQQYPDLRMLVLMERLVGDQSSLWRQAPRIGMLATESSPARLFEGIRRIAGGETVLDPALAVAALTAGSNPLTDREREVLRKSVDGAPAKAIAAELYLSIGTVRNYLSRAVAKTGGRSRFEAVRIAQDEGWI